MDYKAIGKKIRIKRHTLDLTQEELADKLGISTSFLGHIERGTRTMSIETLFMICRELGLSADELLGL